MIKSDLSICPKRIREAPHAYLRWLLKKAPTEIAKKCKEIEHQINVAERRQVEPMFNSELLTVNVLTYEMIEMISAASKENQISIVEVAAADKKRKLSSERVKMSKSPPCANCRCMVPMETSRLLVMGALVVAHLDCIGTRAEEEWLLLVRPLQHVLRHARELGVLGRLQLRDDVVIRCTKRRGGRVCPQPHSRHAARRSPPAPSRRGHRRTESRCIHPDGRGCCLRPRVRANPRGACGLTWHTDRSRGLTMRHVLAPPSICTSSMPLGTLWRSARLISHSAPCAMVSKRSSEVGARGRMHSGLCVCPRLSVPGDYRNREQTPRDR